MRKTFYLLILGLLIVVISTLKYKSMNAAYKSYKLGDFEIVALCDGHVDLSASNFIFDKSDEPQPATPAVFEIPINVYVINTGERVILVDTGLAGLDDTRSGFLGQALLQAGYSPDAIDSVLITHLHPDHMAGLVNGKGERVFKNATVYVSKREADFWRSQQEEVIANDDCRPVFSMARAILKPYEQVGKLFLFGENQELFSGLTAVASHGHTEGHTSFLFESKGQKLLVWGDIVHAHFLQFIQPAVALEFDSNIQQAIETRKRLLAEISAQHILVAGAHLPFPGIGYVLQLTEYFPKNKSLSYSWRPLTKSQN